MLNQILHKYVAFTLVLTLSAVSFNTGLLRLCKSMAADNMSCCKTSDTSGQCDHKTPEHISIRASHSCPCPSMQTGQNESMDELLPVSKGDVKLNHMLPAFSLNKIQILIFSKNLTTAYFQSYLTAPDKLSLLQTYLI